MKLSRKILKRRGKDLRKERRNKTYSPSIYSTAKMDLWGGSNLLAEGGVWGKKKQ